MQGGILHTLGSRLDQMNTNDIKLLVLDVDGVLTDGGILVGRDGEETKRFAVQDGCAIKLWQQARGTVAILSGRGGPAVEKRAAELGIEIVALCVGDKSAGFEKLLSDTGFSEAATAYVGDDLPDLAPMRRAGWPVAVANAVPEVKRAAAYVTRRSGGSGAVAEIVELLLRQQGRWTAQVGGIR